MGKNVIVGQSGGPTAVINSSLAGVIKNAQDRKIPKIYGMRFGIKSLIDRTVLDMDNYITDDMDIELLKRTPSSFLGTCRFKLPSIEENEELYVGIFEYLKELDVGYFFYIGGNDSMDTVNKLSKYADSIQSNIRFMGVTKTIDNDLAVADHTPGYGSAAKYIATMIKEIILDASVYDTSSAYVIEVMGRNAGWLAGAAALSRGIDCDGPDGIYLPEVAFDVDKFMEKVEQTHKHKPVVMVVAEGIKLADGRYVSELSSNENAIVDAFGHKLLTGASRYLADMIGSKLGIKARAIDFSTTQRAAAHMMSRVDMTEAFQAGSHAVTEAVENGATGKAVILTRVSSNPYVCMPEAVDVSRIANVEKTVPLEWITEAQDDVTDDFVRYAMPLVQAEIMPYMVNGIPRHITIAAKDKARKA